MLEGEHPQGQKAKLGYRCKPNTSCVSYMHIFLPITTNREKEEQLICSVLNGMQVLHGDKEATVIRLNLVWGVKGGLTGDRLQAAGIQAAV